MTKTRTIPFNLGLFSTRWCSFPCPEVVFVQSVIQHLAILAPLHLLFRFCPHCCHPVCITLGDCLWPVVHAAVVYDCLTGCLESGISSKPYASLQNCDIATESDHIASIHPNPLLPPYVFTFTALPETSEPRNQVCFHTPARLLEGTVY